MSSATNSEQAERPKTACRWRRLSAADIPRLAHIADTVHPGLPERDEVFLERVRLFPEGCRTLVDEDDNISGYAISHPIRHRQIPPLDHFLGGIAPETDQYFIHDLAILPESRGSGYAQQCIEELLEVAKRYPTSCLVSVYGTSAFWGRFGFCPSVIDEALDKKVKDYGDGASFLERRNDK